MIIQEHTVIIPSCALPRLNLHQNYSKHVYIPVHVCSTQRKFATVKILCIFGTTLHEFFHLHLVTAHLYNLHIICYNNQGGGVGRLRSDSDSDS